jgi:ubiquinone/menaquinone biosynthesis C-methylase UbiE
MRWYQLIRIEDPLKFKISQIWDKSSENFDKRPAHGILSEEERDAWKNQLIILLPPENPVSVLDVGCGTGEISLLLAEIGHTVTGLDLSEGMIQTAKKKSLENGLQIDYKCGDAENPPFHTESFDIIIQRHVIWTLPHPEEAINHWYQLLKPNGRIFLIDSMVKRGMQVDPNRHHHPHYDLETSDLLPFSKGISVDKAEELLTNACFTDMVLHDIGHIRTLQMKTMSDEQRQSYQNKNYYIMTGVKKE